MPMTLEFTAAERSRECLELVDNTRQLIPLLKRNAPISEQIGHLTDETIAAIDDAGVYRMAVPKFYGGLEADPRTVFEVVAAHAEGCPATAWCVQVMLPPTWMIGRGRDEAQDDVFTTPNTRIPSTFGSTGARARRVPGGIQVVGG